MNPLNSEPVLTVAVLTPVVVLFAAKFGLGLDTETATGIATGVLAVGGWFARQRVTPVDKA